MKTNQELLDEANSIDFHCRKDGTIEGRVHSKHERELFFIKKAIEVHGINKYNYGLVQYLDNNKKVAIVCPTHGSFLQAPRTHISGHGCPKCAGVHNYTTEEWIVQARKVHGDIYDYSRVQYKNTVTKIEIVCPEHGSFLQIPSTHTSGHVCPKCAGVHHYNQQEFLDRCREVHGDKYLYEKALYVQANTHVIITCPKHGDFAQTPSSHLNDYRGCPKCAGRNQNILYLLKCKDTGWYKIGITTDSTHRRKVSIGGNVEEIFHIICEDPRKHETYLHKLYEKDREYNPCVRSGNTEFFSLNKDQVQQIIDYMSSIAIN